MISYTLHRQLGWFRFCCKLDNIFRDGAVEWFSRIVAWLQSELVVVLQESELLMTDPRKVE